ncbi:hypothetical protein VTN31DRAFT_2507 [Thermomyces dupontii]|uniref:uncharacterized protein n=1 Tax=Talaromyces thermophilus TaxID=28565 RepID=UPI0037420566
MAPIVHLVRHAQGYHNLSTENHSLPDPDLTDLGKQQCADLQKNFPYHSQVELVVASPIRRTIYTALLGFEPVFQAHPDTKLICLPEAQEASDAPCDTGSDPEVLRKEFEGNKIPVDLSLVQDGWNSKTGKWSPTPRALRKRAREVRRWLRSRPEKEIVLVTHGGILHYITEDWEDYSAYQGTGWTNAEYRTFKFSDTLHKEDLEGKPLEDSDDATLVETPESRQRRGQTPEPPSREEMRALYRKGLEEWTEEEPRDEAKVPEGQEIDGARV